MDHAQEQGLWRAIGSCEQAWSDTQDDIDRMHSQIASIRLRDRLAFVLVLLFGIGVGVVATSRAWRSEAEARAWAPTTYRCPGPYGVDPQPHDWKGGI